MIGGIKLKKILIFALIIITLIVAVACQADIKDFSSNLLNSSNTSEETQVQAIDIDSVTSQSSNEILKGESSNINEDYVYYLNETHNLARIKEDGSESEILTQLTSPIINYTIYQDKIYYQTEQDSKSKVLKNINLDGTNLEENWWIGNKINTENLLDKINFFDDKLYYINNNIIYKVDLDGRNEEYITDEFLIPENLKIQLLSFIKITDNSIYLLGEQGEIQIICRISLNKNYISEDKSRIFKILAASKKEEELNINDTLHFVDDGVYITSSNTIDKVYMLKETEEDLQQIFTGYHLKEFLIAEDSLFMLDDGNDINKLIKLSLDGSSKGLVQENVVSCTINGNTLFFATYKNNILSINQWSLSDKSSNLINIKGDFENINIRTSSKNILLSIDNLGIYIINKATKNITLLNKTSTDITFNENIVEYTVDESDLGNRMYLLQ
jgi:hypothetical protein